MQRGLHIISIALKSCGNLAAFKPWGFQNQTQQPFKRNLDDLAGYIPTVCGQVELWRGFAKWGERIKSMFEHFQAYSYTAWGFNCESMNLSLWRSLWAVHVSVYPLVGTVHLLFLMWFLYHSGSLLMKLVRCPSCSSLPLLFTGFFHPIFCSLPFFLLPTLTLELQRCTNERCINDQGTVRRGRMEVPIKWLTLLWRKIAKFEETKEAKQVGMKEGRKAKDLRYVVKQMSALVKGLHDDEVKLIKQGSRWYADPLCRHHAEIPTNTAINIQNTSRD